MEKNKLVIIAGPTGVGKSKIAISLAKKISGEIISADSMQIYKHMNIGTAKIMPHEQQGITHYMIDCLEPSISFNVVLFKEKAKEAIETIYSHGNIPIVVGGTGFYIQALLYNIDFTKNDPDSAIRDTLENIAKEKGAFYLHNLLIDKDPAAAEKIHPNNIKRVIRALEFYEQTGMKISAHNELEQEKESAYDAHFFVITDDRKKLYQQIDSRVDKMIEKGLVNEVKGLIKMGCKKEWVSMQGIGYKEIISYVFGEHSLDQAIQLIKQESRHYAKRQLTWFRREKEIILINKSEYDDNKDHIVDFMQEKMEKRR